MSSKVVNIGLLQQSQYFFQYLSSRHTDGRQDGPCWRPQGRSQDFISAEAKE